MNKMHPEETAATPLLVAATTATATRRLTASEYCARLDDDDEDAVVLAKRVDRVLECALTARFTRFLVKPTLLRDENIFADVDQNGIAKVYVPHEWMTDGYAFRDEIAALGHTVFIRTCCCNDDKWLEVDVGHRGKVGVRRVRSEA